MKKNLITFAVIAFGGYFAYKWYSKKQKEKREAQEKAKAAAEPIKVEIKETSGKVGASVKSEEVVFASPTRPKTDLAVGVPPMGEGNPRYVKPRVNPNEFMAPPRPMFVPKTTSGIKSTPITKGAMLATKLEKVKASGGALIDESMV